VTNRQAALIAASLALRGPATSAPAADVLTMSDALLPWLGDDPEGTRPAPPPPRSPVQAVGNRPGSLARVGR
jgi:hypothetical protein